MTYVEGGPPETEADWRRVADTLRLLHRLTQGWPQRPGWRSSTDLLHAETGTRIDLGAMPPEGVARCRAAWARLVGRQTCVVHGDLNPRNIRMTADQVENSEEPGSERTMEKLRSALERRGIEFLFEGPNGVGVRYRGLKK